MSDTKVIVHWSTICTCKVTKVELPDTHNCIINQIATLNFGNYLTWHCHSYVILLHKFTASPWRSSIALWKTELFNDKRHLVALKSRGHKYLHMNCKACCHFFVWTERRKQMLPWSQESCLLALLPKMKTLGARKKIQYEKSHFCGYYSNWRNKFQSN